MSNTFKRSPDMTGETPTSSNNSPDIPSIDNKSPEKVFKRYHDPTQPLSRTTFEKIFMWGVQFLMVIMIYYFLARDWHGISYMLQLIRYPWMLDGFITRLWPGTLFLFFVAKLFRPTAVMGGAVFCESFIAIDQGYSPNWILLGYLIWAIFIESRLPYRNGDYFKGKNFFKQFGVSLLQIFVFLPIIYYGITLTPFENPTFTMANARVYFMIFFLLCHLLLIIPLIILLWVMDKLLSPYFPLTDDEQKALDAQAPEDPAYAAYYPRPGECYHEMLSHHPLMQDNHTVVFYVGKVRLYLCTRCTATIFGLVFSSFLFTFLSDLSNWIITPLVAIWCIALLPIIPLTDWGLQAVKIRPANTRSRLVTGFVLGFTMEMIRHVDNYAPWFFVMLIVYFGVFFVLMYIRRKIEDKEMEEEAKAELLQASPDQNDISSNNTVNGDTYQQ